MNPILTYGAAADAAAREALDTRLAPALRQVAMRLKPMARGGDVRQLTTTLDAELPKLHALMGTLVETSMRNAVRRAWRAAPARYVQVYGPDHAQRLRDLKAGNADDVADRILSLPDQWGYTYSQRIWHTLADVKFELTTFMQRHVREAASLSEAVDSLVHFQLHDTTLPRHLRDLARSAELLLADMPSARAQFQTALNRARAYVDTLTPGERGTRGFQRRTVQQLQRAVREGSNAVRDEAVDRFIQRRARYRAGVLLHSEVNRAYGDGILAEYREHDFVQAVRWVLSPLHAHTDVCDLKAAADIGLGPGVYYKSHVPFPDHPSGACRLDPVLAPLHESLDALPFEPQDQRQLQEAMDQLTGPLAKEANRRGRLTDVSQHDLKPLLERLVQTTPRPQVRAPAIPGHLTAEEYRLLSTSRVNGISLRRDTDVVEDQLVHLWHELDADGSPVTRMVLKLRDSPARTALEELSQGTLPGSGTALERLPYQETSQQLLEAIRAVAHEAQQGQKLSAWAVQQVTAADTQYKVLLREVQRLHKAGVEGADVVASALKSHMPPWLKRLKAAIKPGVGQSVTYTTPKALYEHFEFPAFAPPPSGGTLVLQKRPMTVPRSQLSREHVRRTKDLTWQHVTDEYAGTLRDVQVHYWSTRDAPYALRAKLELQVAGHDLRAANTLMDTMESIKIPRGAPTLLDQEELYLAQIANHMGESQAIAPLLRTKEQAARVDKLKAWLAQHFGVDGVHDLSGYNPAGTYPHWGQGKRSLLRPDLADSQEWAVFQRDFRLVYQIQGGDVLERFENILDTGGQLLSTTERVRLGIGTRGLSSLEDLRTGGGDYVFTRIKHTSQQQRVPGIYWHADVLQRLDSISYNHDAYGKTVGDYITQHRQTGVAQWQETAARGSNETLFKHTLSLFDALDTIRIPPNQRNAMLTMFRQHGYERWPDGRALTDVIKTLDMP